MTTAESQAARCSLRAPDDDAVRAFLRAQQGAGFSYEQIGMTDQIVPPPGFRAVRFKKRLGHGDRDFAAAVEGLRTWRQFATQWTHLFTGDGGPRPGQDVAVLVRAAGCWWLNACRVVAVDLADESPRRASMTYGTLGAHAECGEERFLVEMHGDGSVYFHLLAFVRERHALARLGAPCVRRLQRRFARDSAESLRGMLQG